MSDRTPSPAAGATPRGNAGWFEAAKSLIPGGVNSPVRAFGSVGGTPRFIASARGATLTDVEGRQYVDLVGSWGPAILGHAHSAVLGAVHAAVDRGLSFGMPSLAEVRLAQEITARVGAAESIRCVSSGTEATMSAIRLARAATGRAGVIKFAGCYHGHVDALLAAAGSGLATFAMPDSAGVPESVTRDVTVVPYGDLDAVAAAFAARPGEIACIIAEAAPANMGVVPPPPGFNAGLARLAHEHGALFILDEVLTGFRAGLAGMYGLEGAVEGWTPDLLTFGKVIGGGLPVGAFGGRAELMELLAPLGPVYQAGTLSGNPVAMAAGVATLRLLDDALYVRLNAAADAISAGVSDALTAAGVPHRVQRVGTLFSVFFADEPVLTYDDARRQDAGRYAAFFHAMLDGGVHLPPSAFEAWFVSAAHDDGIVARVIEAAGPAARAAARAGADAG